MCSANSGVRNNQMVGVGTTDMNGIFHKIFSEKGLVFVNRMVMRTTNADKPCRIIIS